jgi:hypothetical protein
MKKIFSLFFLMAFFILKNSSAQNTCSTAFQLASGTNFYTLTTGTPNPDTTNDYGCLITESNVTWLYFLVCTPGDITFTISATGSSAVDVDFVAWGPLSSQFDCGLDSSQIVDCGYSTGSTEMADFTAVTAGQYYKIMLSNYSGTAGSVLINQTSGTGQVCNGSTFSCGGVILAAQNICKVSTDPVINHNFIYWDKDTSFHGNYKIQEETSVAGVYTTIATIPSTDTSVYEDVVSNPMIQSFKYRIETADTCGDSLFSAPHSTIHLLTTVSFTGDPQLDWNAYLGFSYSTYYIYRGTSASTLSLYDSISASFTTYTDINPIAGTNYYALSVFPPTPCQPSHSMASPSFSNVSSIVATGINENSLPGFSISPNPAGNELDLKCSFDYSSVAVELFDMAGRKLIAESTQHSFNMRLDLTDISNGIYVVKISTEKGIAEHKIIIAK